MWLTLIQHFDESDISSCILQVDVISGYSPEAAVVQPETGADHIGKIANVVESVPQAEIAGSGETASMVDQPMPEPSVTQPKVCL